MTTPYNAPQAPLAFDEAARPTQPLWKAFWLVFVPTCLGANALSLVGLLFWRSPTGSVLLKAATLASPLNQNAVLWLTLAVPFALATPLGVLAVWRAAPARRFSSLTGVCRLLALAYFAYVAFMLTQGLLRVL